MFPRRAIVAFVLGLSCAAPAFGMYTLTPMSDGLNERTVALGQPFTLDVVITSDTADVHTSAVFQTRFTRAGLVLTGIEWGTPYVSGGPFEDTVPVRAALPVALGPDTLVGGSYPPALTDIELGNALIGSTFGVGTLVTLQFTVPANPALVGTTFISLNPDQIFNGFTPVSSRAGQVFTLNVVIPSPGAGAVLAAGLLGLAGRRRVA